MIFIGCPKHLTLCHIKAKLSKWPYYLGYIVQITYLLILMIKMIFSFVFQIFPGNQNTYRAELRGVSPPIIAKRIRFIPYSEHPRTVCMRVEMYGCKWEGKFSFSFFYEFQKMVVDRIEWNWGKKKVKNHFNEKMFQVQILMVYIKSKHFQMSVWLSVKKIQQF